MKLLTLLVPCYNSQDYMEKCIQSLLPGGDELDILIVDDGSHDRTGAIADAFVRDYPDRVRVIHQENGGHGAGLNTGIANALGLYFKTVDSDDRLDPDALRSMLDLIRSYAGQETIPDLIVNDYVYDTADKQAVFGVTYHHVMQPGRLMTWDTVHHFPIWKQFMIHSLTYRTQMLRDMHLVLPVHTFYEDNIYIYRPLPWVKTISYLHKPLYGYFIGRPDQSVHDDVILRRLDQCTSIAEQMITSYTLDELNKLPRHLRNYMLNNASGQLFTTSALQFIDGHERGEKMNQHMWQTIYDYDPALYKALRHNLLGMTTVLPGKLGKKLLVWAYRIGRRAIQFS